MAEYTANIHGNIWQRLQKLEQIAKRTETAIHRIKKPTQAAASGFNKLGRSMQLTSGFFDRLIAYASIWQGIQLGKSIITRTAEFEGLATALNFASGSMALGGINMDYVTKSAKDLGLALMPALEGFTKLNAAAKGTSLSQMAIRDLFMGISKAVSVLALNSEKAHGTYMAFEQILSKGKVSAEELRRQLGDRIPGAFQIAARAMGVTTTELDKMIRSGKLMSEDFLPRMARQMNEEFTPGIVKSSNTLRAHMNRLNTQLLLLKVGFGTAIIPELTKAIAKFGQLDVGLKRNILWFKEHKSTIFAVAKGIVTLTGALVGLAAVMKLIAMKNFLVGLGPVGGALAVVTVAVMAAVTWYGLFASKIIDVTEAHLRMKKALEGTTKAQKSYDELVELKKKYMADKDFTEAEKMTIGLGAKSNIDDLRVGIENIMTGKQARGHESFLEMRKMLEEESKDKIHGIPLATFWKKLQESGGDPNDWLENLLLPKRITDKMSRLKEIFDELKEIDIIPKEVKAKADRIKAFRALGGAALTEIEQHEAGEGATPKAMAEVLGGGNRIINITIHKQIETLINNFDVSEDGDLSEFKEKVRAILSEALLEAVNEANDIYR
jgi:tape measure domain-containing protein